MDLTLASWTLPGSKNKYCKFDDLSNEATVEEFFISRLIKDLGFIDSEIKPKKDLEELVIGRGRKKESFKPDYVCFVTEKPRLVTEVKAVGEIVDEYLYQGQGYAFELNKRFTGEKPVQYVLMSNGAETKLYYWHELDPILILDFPDFVDDNDKFEALKGYISRKKIVHPPKEKPAEPFPFRRPNDIEEIKNLFRRCHRAIRQADKMAPSPAFYEFTKILFVKLQEDRLLREKEELRRRITTGEPLPADQVTFSVRWIERREEEKEPNPVNTILFKNLREYLEGQVEERKKKRIFDPDEHIKLDPSTTKEIVGVLEHYDLIETNEDLNGRLFETFLNTMMRGPELGQFFTPRSIVKFMTAMADLKVDKEHIDKILDGCCGTAGFLVEAMDDMATKANANPSLSSLEKKRLIDKIRNQCLWGIDAGKDPPIARIARINMYLHEDGGSRIYYADTLDKHCLIEVGIDRELKRDREELKENIVDEGLKFDIILTNPPFAMTVGKKKANELRILKQYDLAYKDPKERKLMRGSLRSSVMFLERYRDLLKPHGKLLIIMEETPLESDKGVNPDVRNFIRENFVVKAVISLPRNSFVQAEATAKTSILYLVKKVSPDEEQAMPFIETSNNVGHDDSGKPTPETNDLFTVEKGSQISGGLIDRFRKWEKGEIPPPIKMDLKDRLDVKNLIPRRRVMLSEWRKNGYDVMKLSDVLEPVKDFVRPRREASTTFKIPSIHFDGTMTLSEERLGRNFKYSAVKQIHEGNIVASRIDIVSGATALVMKEFEGAVVSNEFWVFNPKVANSYYLWQILRSEYIRDALFGYSTGITGRHRVEWDDVNDIEVPIPSKEKQEEIQRLVEESKMALDQAKEKCNDIELRIKAIIG